MQFNWVVGKAYTGCEWVMKLAYLNILWVLFSLGGLIFLGTSPASVALFTILRKWLMNDTDVPIFRTFLNTYKKEFVKSNQLGWVMALIGMFLYFDFKYLITVGGTIQYVLSIPLLIVTILFFITMLYLFPVYVHYDLRLIQYIKNSFYIGIINMHITILMIAVTILIGILYSSIPGIVPFFSISLFSLMVMAGAKQSFNRIEAKQKRLSV
ncbi:putative membrane protein YesL [Neobacillus bataviensis]|uniref:Putative membrane protein YesL n=1 Tax=Neobacillus bataviensis TaxID=220685 RepID=A0A561D6L0_9BACI|nr:YesL family protein [Neobacillus bataviensis]TWD98877.1 putative membrane protein YesL [Neobacillus bataviensis]